MENLYEKTIAIWSQTDLKLNEGISLDLISQMESKLDFKFPEDFKAFYQKVNGFVDFEWNKDMFSLWSLERIYEECKSDQNSNYIPFCDYLINSHAIGYMRNADGIFINTINEKICETFDEFIGLLSINSEKLY
ncbi:SMI1/KNR4 family protein [Flavobacterium hungaricum]|uniref:SMI1/KNR4 family protein n=1 Tax=Flavobacterium hungaricum TaxID=2082725 RepID=A0ABR9THZ4_9FLAO|nr:SMI1/KNR4 family protein [Flavobacterium hungaricum]MBE8724662.1 SMI1/KNR4 family protein [Flavobacterium hungaricum]